MSESSAIASGNRCGHSPESPRFLLRENPYTHSSVDVLTGELADDAAPPEPDDDGVYRDGLGGKRRSRIQYKVIEKIQEYYSKPSVIPMLNAVNGSARQQRTERREACVSLLEAMVYSMDLVTLRVGYPGEHGTGDFVYRTIEWLAEKASISISRAKRAFKDLKSCGILSVKRVCRENDDGSHSSLAASKCFSKAFMLLLGFDKWMSKERKKASARKHEAQVDAEDAAKRTPQARAHSIMMTQMLLNQLTGGNLHDIDDDEPIPDRVY